ncbi:MAG: hypothetical protein DRN53_07520, partial [Thermoprotei archaeon]
MLDTMRIVTLILTIVVILTLFNSTECLCENSDNMYREYYDYIVSNIDLDNIRKHVAYLSSLESRYTGYPGSAKAALYIYNYLRNELGLDVILQNYSVLVPYDNNSSLTLLTPVKRKFRVFALEPNMIDAM